MATAKTPSKAGSKSKKPIGPKPGEYPGKIVDIDVSDEMSSSFLEYAYSVIYSRALPDARDGLKPVHRRILHAMSEMGLRPERGHVKSSRVVGEVMGKFHPHGDVAIYDALVRMAQSFSMGLPLVDGHGNFGSLDSGPAAMRYTEARLALPAMAMVAEADEDTVDFGPNYDGQILEPLVLPAAYPNLLVNGGSGIAVGMATNMAPHNLGEVIAATKYLIENPNATLKQLMKYVPGPDFPTGGQLVGSEGVREAYATGKGSFKVRATVEISKVSSRKMGITIKELPFNIGPEKIVERIADLAKAKKIQGISDIIDLTDGKTGTNVVIELKNGFEPEQVLEQLYKLTPMEDGFAINAVALVNGRPQTLGLKELLQVFIAHRVQVVRRRSEFRKAKATARLTLVEGLLKAIIDIDKVIKIIRGSDDAAAAKEALIKGFKLNDEQAVYILDMPLRRLTKMSKLELETEQKELKKTIDALVTLLKSEENIKKQVSDELTAVGKSFATPRRTVILPAQLTL
ncbi:MAG TPA: DNA topoisomerase (ATP-hydrolyzing) [Candidatus Nanopelagicaceae bacterium]|jgi:DNA gyrase/topoisomerase IV subunit A